MQNTTLLFVIIGIISIFNCLILILVLKLFCQKYFIITEDSDHPSLLVFNGVIEFEAVCIGDASCGKNNDFSFFLIALERN